MGNLLLSKDMPKYKKNSLSLTGEDNRQCFCGFPYDSYANKYEIDPA
jgi:hypothetical protein